MHFPGLGKNLQTACATPAPALSISASTSTPRAKAASSATRICAEVKTGEFNYPPDLLRRRLPLIPLVWLSFSSFARFSCANAWTDGVQISSPWFDRCTVAAGYSRSSPPVSGSRHYQQSYAHGRPPQSPLRAFDGTQQFARTVPRSDS